MVGVAPPKVISAISSPKKIETSLDMEKNRERMKKLGAFLKNRREELSLTQQQLAKAVGYDQSQIISNIERGVAKIPAAKIPEFSQALQMPPERLQLELVALDLNPELANRLALVQLDSINEIVASYQQADAATKERFVSAVSGVFNIDSKRLQSDLDSLQDLQRVGT